MICLTNDVPPPEDAITTDSQSDPRIFNNVESQLAVESSSNQNSEPPVQAGGLEEVEALVLYELSQVGSVLTVESPLAVESSSYQNSEPPDHVGSVLNSDSSSAAWAYVNAVQEAAAPNSGIPPQT